MRSFIAHRSKERWGQGYAFSLALSGGAMLPHPFHERKMSQRNAL
ncbi:hypothetical protein TO73_2172 [Thermus aquaticus Y51MC23]|uniref:Uncharacterized protein n=1 Tax=Thermus aquaticus (strain ATCC BAA-2747 / Y51MC23) TaxID=498848 RepID=A0ABN4IM02_THEA5|nr:hypothetical protein TO73_2172 [Thermus aquaticus Y51MC23]